jgi:hypothetical protein
MKFAELLLVLIWGSFFQEPLKVRYPAADEVPEGFPIGEPKLRHPEARWDLASGVFQQSRTRVRIHLEGLWRFAPVMDPKEQPLRVAMGWLRVPSFWIDPQAPVYDGELRVSEGMWQGRPLTLFSTAWLERELPVPASWLTKVVLLTARPPWSEAELYVNGERVPVLEKSPSGAVYDVTSYLIYPQINLLDLRTKAPKLNQSQQAAEFPEVPVERAAPSRQVTTEAQPALFLDVLPATVHLRRLGWRQLNENTGELEVELRLPPLFPYPVRPEDPVPRFTLVAEIEQHGKRQAVGEKPFELRRPPQEPLRAQLRLPQLSGQAVRLWCLLYEQQGKERILRDEFYPVELPAGSQTACGQP